MIADVYFQRQTMWSRRRSQTQSIPSTARSTQTSTSTPWCLHTTASPQPTQSRATNSSLMTSSKMTTAEPRANPSCRLLTPPAWSFPRLPRLSRGSHVTKTSFDVCPCIWPSIFSSYWTKRHLATPCWSVRTGGLLCWKFMTRSGSTSSWRKMLC